jgi:hypothetical protein
MKLEYVISRSTDRWGCQAFDCRWWWRWLLEGWWCKKRKQIQGTG